MEIKSVNDHAVDRYRERVQCGKKPTKENIIGRILKIAARSFPAEFTHPKFEVFAILNHDFKKAEYLMDECTGMVLVIVNGEIMTVHKNESKRWKRSKK